MQAYLEHCYLLYFHILDHSSKFYCMFTHLLNFLFAIYCYLDNKSNICLILLYF